MSAYIHPEYKATITAPKTITYSLTSALPISTVSERMTLYKVAISPLVHPLAFNYVDIAQCSIHTWLEDTPQDNITRKEFSKLIFDTVMDIWTSDKATKGIFKVWRSIVLEHATRTAKCITTSIYD